MQRHGPATGYWLLAAGCGLLLGLAARPAAALEAPPSTVTELKDAARRGLTHERIAALQRLATVLRSPTEIANEGVTALLGDLARHDPHWRIQLESLRALTELTQRTGSPPELKRDAVAALRAVLADNNRHAVVSLEALQDLGALCDRQSPQVDEQRAINLVEQFAGRETKDLALRGAALRAVGRIGSPHSLDLLTLALPGSQAELREAAAAGLACLAANRELLAREEVARGLRQAAPQVRRLLDDTQVQLAPEARVDLIRILCRVGYADSLELAIQALRSEPELRQRLALVDLLAEVPSLKAIPPLVEIYALCYEPSHRLTDVPLRARICFVLGDLFVPLAQLKPLPRDELQQATNHLAKVVEADESPEAKRAAVFALAELAGLDQLDPEPPLRALRQALQGQRSAELLRAICETLTLLSGGLDYGVDADRWTGWIDAKYPPPPALATKPPAKAPVATKPPPAATRPPAKAPAATQPPPATRPPAAPTKAPAAPGAGAPP